MCGRYIFNDGKNEYIQKFVEDAQSHFSQELLFRKDVFPNSDVIVAAKKNNQISYSLMHWGCPLNKKIVINARSETYAVSPFFKGFSPCIILASSYYEFNKDKEPYLFFVDNAPLFMAGIHKNKQLVILTENASAPQSNIHLRQPVIFNYEDAKKWCQTNDTTSLHHLSIQNRKQIKI